MAITVTNVLQGPADIWTGAVGVAEPTSNATAPGAGWVNAGSTSGGTKLSIKPGYGMLTVDQAALPVGARLQDMTVEVSTTLAEQTLANLRVALNQAVAATTFLEVDSAITNTDPNYAAVLLIGQRPGGGGRMVIVRKVLSTAGVETEYKKDGQTLIPVTLTGFYVSSSIKPVRVDDTP